jgi:hypothetical protein
MSRHGLPPTWRQLSPSTWGPQIAGRSERWNGARSCCCSGCGRRVVDPVEPRELADVCALDFGDTTVSLDKVMRQQSGVCHPTGKFSAGRRLNADDRCRSESVEKRKKGQRGAHNTQGTYSARSTHSTHRTHRTHISQYTQYTFREYTQYKGYTQYIQYSTQGTHSTRSMHSTHSPQYTGRTVQSAHYTQHTEEEPLALG